MTSISPLPSAILVHEYVTGGGWPAPDLPPGLAEEALAILRALLADLRAWGRFPVVTTRDRRLRHDAIWWRIASSISTPKSTPRHCLELARDCGAALVVAPEGGGALERSELAGGGRRRLPARQPRRRPWPWLRTSGSATGASRRPACRRRRPSASRRPPPPPRRPGSATRSSSSRSTAPAATASAWPRTTRSSRAALRQPALRGPATVLVQRYAGGHGGQRVAAGRRLVARPCSA